MSRTLLPIALIVGALLPALPAHAVYKVIGPDGKVTYTDTPPPADSKAKVSAVAVGAGGGAPNLTGLPFELQQAATKYPVTLYSTRECRPCDAGRRLLQQRGIPFSETTLAATSADQAALQQLAGTTNLPVLTVGQQQLKGLTPGEWHGYLDAAGYPRESKLPASYSAPSPTPMVTPAPAEPAATPGTDAAPAGTPAPAAPARPASGPNIRF
jgi:glutaredoxin